jgi:hypothetical protein
MSEDKLPNATNEPLRKNVHLLAVLIPLVLVCDIAAFAVSFW